MVVDLVTDDGLRKAANSALEKHRESSGRWLANLRKHLERIRDADEALFLSEAFQRQLWDEEAVSATGMGNINVSFLYSDLRVAQFLWELKGMRFSSDEEERDGQIVMVWKSFLELVVRSGERTPRLKMYRVLAALQPSHFTSIAHVTKIKQLARKMSIAQGIEHPVLLHRRVLDRLADVLGEPDSALDTEQLERMTLPWILFSSYVQERGEDVPEVAGPAPGEVALNPLPANRRRRGLLAIAGLLPSVLGMLEFAKEGCKREDFKEHLRSINSKLAPSSVNTQLNALIAEWGVLQGEGDNLNVTPRGEALLDSGDPDEVADWMLTRILGFDNLLYRLRDTPSTQKELIAELQRINPGWTSSFAPTSLISWLRGLDLARMSLNKNLELTERGRDWANRIHWTPEVLSIEVSFDHDALEDTSSLGSVDSAFLLPTIAEIVKTLPRTVHFKPSLIAHLHAGLWSDPVRHFAVLTGLSGAGKTLLARHYATALWQNTPGAQSALYTLPVQPGWHDPSCLLGYVNPLNNESYIRTGFLDFLLTAHRDPDRPYTAVLDEMNLSHPEQYLAPLLSAMETGGDIEFHASEGEIGGVPPRILYPRNLLLIGTVNMDETTQGLSDKVLDRATVIEFWDIDVDAYPRWATSGLPEEMVGPIRSTLKSLIEVLKPVRLHFGWRTIGDILGYVRAATLDGALTFEEAFDYAIYAKVLPKLRGEDSPRMRSAFEKAASILDGAALQESSVKVASLHADLLHMGSARFWR